MLLDRLLGQLEHSPEVDLSGQWLKPPLFTGISLSYGVINDIIMHG